MPQGKSGRIIIDVDPEFKEEVYQAVHRQGFGSMKEWFIQQAARVCEESRQPSLGLVIEEPSAYHTKHHR